MAQFRATRKAAIKKKVKPILKKWRVKAQFKCEHYNWLIITITEGPLDFCANYNATMEKKPRRWTTEWTRLEEHTELANHYTENYSGEVLDFWTEFHGAIYEDMKENGQIVADDEEKMVIYTGTPDQPYILTTPRSKA